MIALTVAVDLVRFTSFDTVISFLVTRPHFCLCPHILTRLYTCQCHQHTLCNLNELYGHPTILLQLCGSVEAGKIPCQLVTIFNYSLQHS